MKVDQLESVATHKGTGFVRFKNQEDAAQLLQLSQQMERALDAEHSDKKTKNKKQKKETLIGQ